MIQQEETGLLFEPRDEKACMQRLTDSLRISIYAKSLETAQEKKQKKNFP